MRSCNSCFEAILGIGGSIGGAGETGDSNGMLPSFVFRWSKGSPGRSTGCADVSWKYFVEGDCGVELCKAVRRLVGRMPWR